LAGIPLGRFSNYYILLLVLLAFVILVFTRLNNSPDRSRLGGHPGG
jgi:branched-chain amino acid transport system permease protein